mgnify:CR=1 FL=1
MKITSARLWTYSSSVPTNLTDITAIAIHVIDIACFWNLRNTSSLWAIQVHTIHVYIFDSTNILFFHNTIDFQHVIAIGIHISNTCQTLINERHLCTSINATRINFGKHCITAIANKALTKVSRKVYAIKSCMLEHVISIRQVLSNLRHAAKVMTGTESLYAINNACCIRNVTINIGTNV